MQQNAFVRKTKSGGYFPSHRYLYSSDSLTNPYAKTPSAVAILNHLIARAAMWDRHDLDRGTVRMSRRELIALTEYGERSVRRGLVALEMNGAIACLCRGRGRAAPLYAIVDFDSVCKVVRPTTAPQLPHENIGYGRGIGRSPQRSAPQLPHNADSSPLSKEEEEKKLLQPPPYDAGARTSPAGGGGGTPISFTSRSQPEDWEGLAQLDRDAEQPSVEDPKPCEPSPAGRQEDYESRPEYGPPVSAPPPVLSVEALGRLWNECAGAGVPKVDPTLLERSQSQDGPLTAAVRANPDPEYWRALFELVAHSPFLQGKQGHRGFRVDLAWIIDPGNAAKVICGKYADQALAVEQARRERLEEQSRAEEEAKRAKEAAREVTRLAAEKAAKERDDAEQRIRQERAAKGRITLSRELVFGGGPGGDS